MITIQEESLIECLEEIKNVLPVHYEELAINKDKVPLDPIYEVYIQKEYCGELLFCTVRKDSSLIGYFIGFVSPELHYKTCLTCKMDIFYIHPDHRGSELGLKLFKFVERNLKSRGVQRWYVGSKLHKDCGNMFKSLGFNPIETYYSKWLGE